MREEYITDIYLVLSNYWIVFQIKSMERRHFYTLSICVVIFE